MANETESDFVKDLDETPIGRIYRCACCSHAYFVEAVEVEIHANTFTKFDVTAFDLTANSRVIHPYTSARNHFKRADGTDLLGDEAANLREYKSDREQKGLKKWGLTCQVV